MPADKASFFQDVYEIVRLVPRGRVTSYGAIAAYLGTKGSSRMVGWAVNSPSMPDDVPAHRVVNRNGLLSGKHHFGGSRMQDLLEAEGIKVQNDKVTDFGSLFWDPMKELM